MGDNPPEELRLILIGKTGSGKSASGNTILGLPGHFLSKCSASSITQVCQVGTSEYHVEEEVGSSSRRRRSVVVDLPGFGDTNLSLEQIITEVSRCVVLTAPGPHAFLLVVPLGRYTEEDNMAVTVMAAVFGEAALRNHTVVLFTRGDDLEEPMEEYLASAPAHLKTLIDRCGGRYHVLNNRAPSDVEQVHKLLRKVEQVVDDNGGGCYTNAMYREAVAARREEEDRLRREEEGRLRRRSVRERGRRTVDGEESGGKRPQSPPSPRGHGSSQPWGPWFSRVMKRVKVVVAAVLTGLVVGAVCGAVVPLVAGAAWMGSTIAASSLVAGAAIGGTVGGVMGIVVGLEADSREEGAQEVLRQVGTFGVRLVEAVRDVAGAVAGRAVGAEAVTKSGSACPTKPTEVHADKKQNAQ